MFKMNIKKVFLSSLIFCCVFVLAISFFMFTISSNVTAEDTTDKLLDGDYQDSLRTIDSIRVPNEDSTLFKSYDVSEKTILIEDDKYETLIELKLLSDYKQHVGVGIDTKVAEFLLIDFSDLEIFEKADFYNINKDYEKEIKQFRLKYPTDYIEEICYEHETFDNKTNMSLGFETICYDEMKTNWTELKYLKELPKEGVRVGLFTDTTLGEHIEWVPTIEGFECLEWASYLVDGLISYYKLDESSGSTAFDSLGINNATNGGADVNVPGKINTAYDFEKDNTDYLLTGIDWTNMESRTYSGWFKLESSTADQYLFDTRLTDDSVQILVETDNDLVVEVRQGGGYVDVVISNETVPDNVWTHIGFTLEDTTDTLTLYINGENVGSGIHGASVGHASDMNSFEICGRTTGTELPCDSLIDEIAIYDYAVNQTGFTDLYNSGRGLSYPFTKCVFNGTVKDGDGNAINGVKIVIATLEDDTLYKNTTSDASGLWSLEVSVNGNYTVYAYEPNNITRAGDIFPYVECIMELG